MSEVEETNNPIDKVQEKLPEQEKSNLLPDQDISNEKNEAAVAEEADSDKQDSKAQEKPVKARKEKKQVEHRDEDFEFLMSIQDVLDEIDEKILSGQMKDPEKSGSYTVMDASCKEITVKARGPAPALSNIMVAPVLDPVDWSISALNADAPSEGSVISLHPATNWGYFMMNIFVGKDEIEDSPILFFVDPKSSKWVRVTNEEEHKAPWWMCCS